VQIKSTFLLAECDDDAISKNKIQLKQRFQAAGDSGGKKQRIFSFDQNHLVQLDISQEHRIITI
jgi:hypothetical protein